MAPYLAEAGSMIVYVAMAYGLAKLLQLSGMDSYIFYIVMAVLGLVGMGLWLYFKMKWQNRGGSVTAGGEGDAGIDQIVREADRRIREPARD